jgi:hypothetical protein
VRLIGVIAARRTEKGKTFTNDRLVGVPQTKVNKPRVRELLELGATRIEQIEHFFVSYTAAQGRTFKPTRRLGAAQAERMLRPGMGGLK